MVGLNVFDIYDLLPYFMYCTKLSFYSFNLIHMCVLFKNYLLFVSEKVTLIFVLYTTYYYFLNILNQFGQTLHLYYEQFFFIF